MANKETDYGVYMQEGSYFDPKKVRTASSSKGTSKTKTGSGKKSGASSKSRSTAKSAKSKSKAKKNDSNNIRSKSTLMERFKDFWTRKDNKKQKIVVVIGIILLIIILIVGGYAWAKLSLIDTNGEDGFVEGDYESDIDLSDMDSITDANSLNELLMKWATNGGDLMQGKHVKNVLLIGKDSKSSLADSMILASVNEKTKQITLVSFYRDCYIYIQPEGKKPSFGKLNAAYSRGGAKCVIETIQNNFKIKIDDYVMVDYSSFPKIIDALGGVDVNVTAKEANYLNSTWQNWTLTGNPVSYKVGVNHLNGEKALMFCRIRKLDSDVGRTERQRRVISSIITSFKSAGISKINAAVNELFPNVKTSMSRTEILSFAANAVSGGWLSYPMSQATMPPDGMANGGYVGDQWVWIVDYEGSAYQLQNLLYGKSNIEMSDDRVSPITLKPTAVTSVSTTAAPVVEESTTKAEMTTLVEEESTSSLEDVTGDNDVTGEDMSNEEESTSDHFGLGDLFEQLFPELTTTENNQNTSVNKENLENKT